MIDSVILPKIGFCGEVSSGKSTALQSVLRKAFLPDFFGIQNRPMIRVILGADAASALYVTADGTTHEVDDPADIEVSEDITEIVVKFESTYGVRRACELIEFAPLRDGFVDDAQVQAIAECDVLVWSTIGSQAWRLSEKTILDDIAARLPAKKLLVVTRADKFRNDADRSKIWNRLETETSDYFPTRHLLGVSPKLFEMPKASKLWQAAGAADFVKSLSSVLRDIPKRTAVVEDIAAPDVAAEAEVDVTAPQEGDVAVEPKAEVVEPEAPVEEADAPIAEAPEPEVEDVAEPVEEAAPIDPLDEIISTTKGIVAIGICDVKNPEVLGHLFGEDDDIDRFGQFCIASLSAAGRISEAYDSNDQPSDMQIVTDKHNLFLSQDGTQVAFIVGRSSQISVGITRTVLSRVIAAGLTSAPDLFEAA